MDGVVCGLRVIRRIELRDVDGAVVRAGVENVDRFVQHYRRLAIRAARIEVGREPDRVSEAGPHNVGGKKALGFVERERCGNKREFACVRQRLLQLCEVALDHGQELRVGLGVEDGCVRVVGRRLG